MMKNTLVIISLLIAVNGYCQKELKISETKPTQIFFKNLDHKLDKVNLEDLRTGKEKSIRIWKQNEVLSLGDSTALTLYISQGENIISETYTFKSNYNLDTLQKEISAIVFLENKQQRGKIDEYPITVEICTAEEYQLVSGYNNEDLEKNYFRYL